VSFVLVRVPEPMKLVSQHPNLRYCVGRMGGRKSRLLRSVACGIAAVAVVTATSGFSAEDTAREVEQRMAVMAIQRN
jgi:hypothetical protein